MFVSRPRLVFFVAGFLSVLPSTAKAQVASGTDDRPPDTLPVALFTSSPSSDSLPAGWVRLIFGDEQGETSFLAAQQSGRYCMAATATATASGIIRRVDVDPEAYPRVTWSWWVDGPVPGGDLTKKEGDDFSARLFVNFEFQPDEAGFWGRMKHRLAGGRFGGEAPGRSLIYVWGNLASPGTMAPSAYTDQAVQFVVRSGAKEARTWWTEERNVLQDYREAFGEDPPSIVGFAVMTDADDTAASAAACYGDILLLRR